MGLREILIPSDKKFFESFTSQANNILRASEKLVACFETGQISVEQARKEIREIEHENDKIVHSIYERLNQSFVTPIDSDDILKLSSDYDTIIDYVYATINRFYLYKIEAPDEAMKKFATIVEKCATEIVKLTSGLEKIRSKKNGSSASAEEIDRLENEADELLNEAVASLFERKIDPLDVMKFKEIYEFLEQTTDKFEDTALLLRDIALRYT
jgi:uncharacterized protein